MWEQQLMVWFSCKPPLFYVVNDPTPYSLVNCNVSLAYEIEAKSKNNYPFQFNGMLTELYSSGCCCCVICTVCPSLDIYDKQ